jgi:hypothetical protein
MRRAEDASFREDLLRRLGLSDIEYLPDDDSPPVDVARLQGLVNDELDEEDATEVCRLIGSYRTWKDAYARVLGARPNPDAGSQDEEN